MRNIKYANTSKQLKTFSIVNGDGQHKPGKFIDIIYCLNSHRYYTI